MADRNAAIRSLSLCEKSLIALAFNLCTDAISIVPYIIKHSF